MVSSLWGSNLCGSPANPSQKETHWTEGVDFGDWLIHNTTAVLVIIRCGENLFLDQKQRNSFEICAFFSSGEEGDSLFPTKVSTCYGVVVNDAYVSNWNGWQLSFVDKCFGGCLKNVKTGVRNSEPLLPMPPTAGTIILGLILTSIAASLLVKEAALFIRIRKLRSCLQVGRFWGLGMLNIVVSNKSVCLLLVTRGLSTVENQLRVNDLF